MEKGDRVRKITLSRRFAQYSLIVGSIFCLLLIIMSVHYFHLLGSQSEFRKARIQNFYLSKKMGGIEGKVHNIDKVIEQVQELSKKLNIIAGVKADISEEVFLQDNESSFQISESILEDVPAPLLQWEDDTTFDHLSLKLDHQKESLASKIVSLEEILNILNDRTSVLTSTPSIRPTRGWISSGFGMRIDPWTGKKHMHEGIDIAARAGSEVRAAADGVIIFAGMNPTLGKGVVINHGYGFVTRYGHNSEIYVEIGKKVRRGDVIAAIGSTGRSTGPHLHYEVVRNQKPINPMNYILD